LREAELAVLAGFHETLKQSSSLEEVTNELLYRTLGAAGATQGIVYLLGGDGLFSIQASLGYPPGATESLKDFFGHFQILQQAIDGGKPLVLPSRDVPSDLSEALVAQSGAGSILIVPHRLDDAELGALVIGSTKIDAAEDLLPFGSAVGGQISQSLGLTRALAKVRESEKRYRDLSAELEHRARDRTKQLEAVNSELEAFSYSVAHDLKGPLVTMTGFARILLEDCAGALPDEARRYLGLIEGSGKKMGKLIDDLLAFSRVSRQSLHKELVAPDDLIREITATLGTDDSTRQVKIEIGPLPTCHADPALRKIIFVNLLGNAMKFTRLRKGALIECGCAAHGKVLTTRPVLSGIMESALTCTMRTNCLKRSHGSIKAIMRGPG